jgi:hypothetical protein
MMMRGRRGFIDKSEARLAPGSIQLYTGVHLKVVLYNVQEFITNCKSRREEGNKNV